jgi:exonuclease III
MKFTFVSWNIEGGKRFEEIVDFLRGVGADVIQLQESGTSGKGLAAADFNCMKNWGKIGFGWDLPADVLGGRWEGKV